MPVSLNAGLDLALVQFNLEASADRLTNLVMGTLAGEVTSVTLIPVGPNQAQVRFNLNGSGPVANSRTLGLLNFFATTNGGSAIVPLHLSALSAQTIGGATVNLGAGNDGRVIIVGRQPVLTMQNPPSPLLTLYGVPGASYVIECRTNLASSAWTTWQGLTLNGTSTQLPIVASQAGAFYRAYEMSGKSSRLVASQDGSSISLLLLGTAGTSLQLQTSTNLGSPNWQNLSSFNLTNSFQVLTLTNDGSKARFYRLFAP